MQMSAVVVNGIESMSEKIKTKIRIGLIFMIYSCIIARLGKEKVERKYFYAL